MTPPEVSVIVPARNEEASLGACLASLTAQTGVTYEIILVDDGSTDHTRGIAESFPGIRIISPGPLPPGWSGKSNAVTAGAQLACGAWLLFTDADTVHRPGSLARSLAEARQQNADLLSYSPEQEVHGMWESAVMPVIFAELAATYRPAEVSDPKSVAAAANGQYILISREAYDAVGGHATVAGTLLEDVALARAVKLSGRKIFFRYGGDAVSTRMYRNFRQLREGWTKNLALLFPHPERLAAWRMAEFLAIAVCSGITVRSAVKHQPQAVAASGALACAFYALFWKRIRRAHFSGHANLLSLIGLPIFSYLLLQSSTAYKRGTVSWKGRAYPGMRSRGIADEAVAPALMRDRDGHKFSEPEFSEPGTVNV